MWLTDTQIRIGLLECELATEQAQHAKTRRQIEGLRARNRALTAEKVETEHALNDRIKHLRERTGYSTFSQDWKMLVRVTRRLGELFHASRRGSKRRMRTC